MHNSHVAKSIPKLIPEIKQQLAKCETDLAALGRPRSTRAEQLSCLVQLSTDFSRLSIDALEGSYHNLPSEPEAKLRKIVQDRLSVFKEAMCEDFEEELPELESQGVLKTTNSRLYSEKLGKEEVLQDILSIIKENRGREFPDEVNPNVIKVLWKKKTENWIERATVTVQAITEDIKKAMLVYFRSATPEEELRNAASLWLAEFLPSILNVAELELENLIADESTNTWTLAPQYTSEIAKQREEYLVNMDNLPDEDVDIAEIRNEIQVWLTEEQDLEAALMTYIRLKAYYEISMYRFIDNIGLQVVERHLLGRKSPLRMFTPAYVVQLADEDPELLKSIAGENEEKVAERISIIRDRNNLKTALATAHRYGFSSS